jgi:carbonic anhydrase
MSSLRSARLILSLVMCNLGLVNCGAETLRPSTPETSVQFESAAGWMTPTVDPGPDSDSESSADAVMAHLASLQQARRWTYEGEKGPSSWGDLSPDYAACKTGSMQSPIDIVTKDVQADRKLELIDFGYRALPLRIFNDGRTVQVENDTPAAINAAGDTWKLASLQLHSPSEHTIDGKHTDLEVELVHRSHDGQLAVVSLLFKTGKENAALAPMFDAMPSDVTSEAPQGAGASLDLSAVIPASPSYFSYVGSLTTPDCTEGVRWFVLQPVGEVSQAQLEKLHAVTGPRTNRPVQPLGARNVLRPQ